MLKFNKKPRVIEFEIEGERFEVKPLTNEIVNDMFDEIRQNDQNSNDKKVLFSAVFVKGLSVFTGEPEEKFDKFLIDNTRDAFFGIFAEIQSIQGDAAEAAKAKKKSGDSG